MLWDAAHHYRKPTALDGGRSRVYGVAFSPDGNTLAAAGDDGKVVLWDAAHDYRKLHHPRRAAKAPSTGVAFSPDGTRSPPAAQTARWCSGTPPTTTAAPGPRQRPSSVYGVAFSPDGNTLAAAGGDGKVRALGRRPRLRKLAALDSGQTSVTGSRSARTGSTLAAAGDDGKVRALGRRPRLHQARPALDSGQDSVHGVAFSPDGNTLAAAGDEGKVVLWDIFWHDLSDLKAKVCGLVHGNLTKAEWETLAPGLPYSTTCPD